MTANFTRRKLVAGAGSAGRAATPTQAAAQTKAVDKAFGRTKVEGTARYFQDCIRGGNLDGALSCFDAEAAYVASPGKVVRGRAEIRKALESLIAMKPNLQAKRSLVLEVAVLARSNHRAHHQRMGRQEQSWALHGQVRHWLCVSRIAGVRRRLHRRRQAGGTPAQKNGCRRRVRWPVAPRHSRHSRQLWVPQRCRVGVGRTLPAGLYWKLAVVSPCTA